MKSLRSLIIATSHNNPEDLARSTGVWLEDFAAAYFMLKDGGEYITVASPAGGQIPTDPRSKYPGASTKNTLRFATDSQAMYHFAHSLPLNEIKPEYFDLLFLAGGYGAMWDFPADKNLQRIIKYFVHQNKPVGFVGHAAAALTLLTLENKEPFVKGRKLTAFSNSEELSIEPSGIFPFSLESALCSLGALYSKTTDFNSYVITDGNIITGQNPASTTEVAVQLLLVARARIKITATKTA